MRLFLHETTAYGITMPQYRTYECCNSGLRGLLNRLIVRWVKWRGQHGA